MMFSLALIFYLLLNLAALYLYAADKFAARRGTWRTSEATLLRVSLLGGALGGLLAMVLFHHKTRKPIFWGLNLLGLAGHLLLLGWLAQLGVFG